MVGIHNQPLPLVLLFQPLLHTYHATYLQPSIMLGMCENNPDDGGRIELAGLNDTLGAEVVIKHWLAVDDTSDLMPIRERVRQLNYGPTLLFAQTSTPAAWPHLTSSSPLAHQLPQNVDLTTWQLLDQNRVLLRLSHVYMVDEHPTMSKPVTVHYTCIMPHSERHMTQF